MAERGESAVSLVNAHTLQVESISNKVLDSTLRSFWELESLGPENVLSDPVCDQFASTLQVKNKRYEASLPWHEYHDNLPDNYNLSQRGYVVY